MQKQYCLILLFICFFLENSILAQVLNGKVINDQQQPLKDASIQILNKLQQTITDSSGNFSLQLTKGNYILQTSFAGYKTSIDSVTISDTDISIRIILETDVNKIDEVIVFANKREELLLQTPVSITYLNADKINNTKTWEISNLAGMVPNLQYANLGVNYQQQIAIRGISVFSETPSVATFIDGVNALDIAANGLQLMDIERIEVLKGPQGTLYGRNAMAGVINITTKQPTNKLSAFAEVSAGNQGLQRYGFGIKTPVVKNKVFLGFSGQFQKQRGYYTNDLSDKTSFDKISLAGSTEDGKRMGDEASWYGNFFLKFLPNHKMSITLNSKVQYDKSVGASAYYQAVENSKTAFENPYKFAVNRLGSNSRLLSNNSLAIIYDHQKFRFFSTSAYQHILQAYNGIDQDLYAYDVATGSSYRNKPGDAYPQGVFSQEFRITNPAKNTKYTWTAGAYIFFQKYDKRYATVYEELAKLFGTQPGIDIAKSDQRNTGTAFFGNFAYTHKKWTFSAGLRADYENRRSEVARYYMNPDGSKTFSLKDTLLNSHYYAFSPSVGINYKINKQIFTYISYSRGFRAGGNNMFSAAKYLNYLPEYSDNLEVGVKYKTPNDKLYLTGALFLLIWRNMQLDMQPEPGVWIISNVGKALNYGLEAELNAKPYKGIEIDLNLGLNNAKYGDFNFLGKNIKGNQTILAPVYTLFAAFQHTVPLKRKINFFYRFEYRSIGKQYFDLTNTIAQKPYHLLNARVGISIKYFNIAFWTQNVTGTKYIAYAMPGYFKYTILNRPRTFGGTITFKI
jgi:iron complex outermembrane receptor protein